jgi:hypothetical protein
VFDMLHPRIVSPALVLAAGLLAAASPASAADRSKGLGDRFWTAPDIAHYPVTTVAMLPPATYDGNAESRKLVESAVGQALKGSGHHWVSPFLVNDYLSRAGGDSLTKALRDKLLKNPRLDSLDAPYVSRALHARGVLTVRVDEMERRELEPGQSGRPTTTVQLHAALVDSTGRLLWTASSNETLEGEQQDADANVIGVKASGLNTEGVGNTTKAPAYQEVLLKICQRWVEPFPKPPAPDSSGTGK